MRRYSQTIVEHFSRPRNLGRLERPDVTADAVNPCCGDRLHLEVNLLDTRITACRFLAHGCAPTIALGSLLTEALRGVEIDSLAEHDADWVADLAGGLQASHRHCAVLGRDLLQALVRKHQAHETMRSASVGCSGLT